jgi:hypothetical protein
MPPCHRPARLFSVCAILLIAVVGATELTRHLGRLRPGEQLAACMATYGIKVRQFA